MSRADVAAPAALTRAEVLATGESIARMQEPSGAITWPDGHVDVWDHVECAMALSACGLREPAGRAGRHHGAELAAGTDLLGPVH